MQLSRVIMIAAALACSFIEQNAMASRAQVDYPPLAQPLAQGPIVAPCFYPLAFTPTAGSSSPSITPSYGTFVSTAADSTAVAGTFFDDATPTQATVPENQLMRVAVAYMDITALAVNSSATSKPGFSMEGSVTANSGESHTFSFAIHISSSSLHTLEFCVDKPLGSQGCKTNNGQAADKMMYNLHVSFFRRSSDAPGLWQICPEYGRWLPHYLPNHFYQFVQSPDPLFPTGCMPLQFADTTSTNLTVNPLTVKYTGEGTVTHQGFGICGPNEDIQMRFIQELSLNPLGMYANASIIDQNLNGHQAMEEDILLEAPPYCKDIDTCEFLLEDATSILEVIFRAASPPYNPNFTNPCMEWEFAGPSVTDAYPFGVYDTQLRYEHGKDNFRGSAYIVKQAAEQVGINTFFTRAAEYCRQYQNKGSSGLEPCYMSFTEYNYKDGLLKQEPVNQLELRSSTLGPVTTYYMTAVNISTFNPEDELPRSVCINWRIFNSSFLEVTGARYLPNGAEISLNFEGRPDILPTPYTCGDIFDPETMALLSSNSVCVAMMNEIRIILYGDEKIAPGNTIGLQENKVLLRNRPIANAVPVDEPVSIPQPIVDISDIEVPACAATSTITIDGRRSTGSLGRDWLAVWYAINCKGDADCDEIGLQLLEEEDALLVALDLGQAGFEEGSTGSFDVVLELTNYLTGAQNGTAHITIANDNSPRPTLRLRGPARVNRGESFDLEAILNTILCDNTHVTGVEYSWSATPEPIWKGISSATGSRLSVPAYGLDVGTYSFQVTASVSPSDSNTPVQVQAFFNVEVSAAAPIALVTTLSQANATTPAGLPQSVTVAMKGHSLTLDASASFNPDCLQNPGSTPGCTAPGTFSWSCCLSEDPFGPNVGSCPEANKCPDSIANPLSTLTNARTTLLLPTDLPDGVHLTFAVTYTQAGATSNPAYTTVTARDAKTRVMAVTVTGASPSGQVEGLMASSADEIGIFATNVEGAQGAITYKWDVISPARINASDPSWFQSDLKTGVMLLKPNVLMPSEQLAVHVVATDMEGGEAQYWVQVTVATPPRGGSMELSATTGVGSKTIFTASFDGWVANHAVLFEVEYSGHKTGADGNLVGFPSATGVLSFTLPGPTTGSATVYVTGIITDVRTGESVKTEPIAVTVQTAKVQGESNDAAASRLLQDEVGPALAKADFDGAIGGMYGVVALLNANSGSPSNEERNARASIVSDVKDLLNGAGSGYSTSAVAVHLLKQSLQNRRAPASAAKEALPLLSNAADSLKTTPYPLQNELISSYIRGTVSAWTIAKSDKTSAGTAVSNLLSVGRLMLTGSGADGFVTALKAPSTSFAAARGSVTYLQQGVKVLTAAGATLHLDSTFKPPSSAGCEYIDVSLGDSTDAPADDLVKSPIFVSMEPSVHCSDQTSAMQATPGSARVRIPVSQIADGAKASCVAWNSDAGAFSNNGVTTVSVSSSSVTCEVSGSRAIGVKKTEDGGFPVGAIIGIAAGGVALVAIITIVIVVRRRRRRRSGGEGFTEVGQYGSV